MTTRKQERIFRTNLRAASGRLALTIALMLAVLATPGAAAQTFTVIHTFTGQGQDGANPYAGLVMDKAGNLYGTTRHFGLN